jgi:hypothetical protein
MADAIGQKARHSPRFACGLGREKGRAGREPALLETRGHDTNQRRHLRRLLGCAAAVWVSSRRVFCRESAARQQLRRLLRSQQTPDK